MATYSGAVLPSGLPGNPAYGAAAKFLPAPLTLPYAAALAGNPPNAGVKTNNLPISEIVSAFSGNLVRQFEQDWYHHVHLLPATIALGNLLSTQMRQVEVWNAHFASQTLTAVIGANDGGISLAAPANPPTTYGMLESRLHNVSVSLDGPPVIEADFTFQFPDEAPTLSISGRRVVVFGLKPNWADGWLERLMWATDVLTARDGTEQRVSLRAKPRRSLEFSILVGSVDAALLDVLLSAWQSRVYALPIWPDKAVLTAAIAAGSTVIPLTTTNLEYEADGLLVIGSDSRNTEAAEVLSVASNAVTLKQPLLQSWPAGAFVTPARTARLRVTQAVSRVTDAIATARLVFDIAGTTAITKQDSTTTFNSTPVWITRPNRVRDVESDYRRLAEVLDFDTGITAVDDHAARPFVRRSFDYLFKNRTEVAAFKAWLAARQGRLTAFWHPTWEASIVPVKKILSNQTVMTVASRGYALYFNPMPGRTEAAFLYKNGTWYFRTVSSFGAGTIGDEEVMTINQSFGFDANPEDWIAIYFLEKTRLDADQIEINWQTDSVVEASIPMLSVKA
ncbi:hypothetical protein SKTS_30450 [Sulfurimicrobium lacus]|uniref:Uncharacterized protein n=1 Tax=Sulfurimicrobium lacus TaxID=2715678 RepID=A0A6F8VHG9_9PROT|nr:hypothetical protein [Sulfurimicrobium lacus]BCB28159.1 hypothetical protein SKTS_30450 [Sulfurimicrobium lacus]